MIGVLAEACSPGGKGFRRGSIRERGEGRGGRSSGIISEVVLLLGQIIKSFFLGMY